MTIQFSGVKITGGVRVTEIYLAVGQTQYTTPGTYSWTVPDNVYSISAVTIGAGGGCRGQTYMPGGGGGGLAYGNDMAVTPGQVLYLRVGAIGTTTSESSWIGPNADGTSAWLIGGAGSSSATTSGSLPRYYGGGGGAGGYNTVGGKGGDAAATGGSNYAGAAGGTSSGSRRTGGFAGGQGGTGQVSGTGSGSYSGSSTTDSSGGQGAAGGGSSYINLFAYEGGGVGLSGANPSNTTCTGDNNGGANAGLGSAVGGGAGGGTTGTTGAGGDGGVRIMWPGSQRLYPSTRTANE